MEIKKYRYFYDLDKGYTLAPKNTAILKQIPQDTKFSGLVKVIKDKDVVYLFFKKDVEKVDNLNRPIDFEMEIYEIEKFDFKKVLEMFDIEYSGLSDKEKKSAIYLISHPQEFKFKNDYFPLLMAEVLDGFKAQKFAKPTYFEVEGFEKCLVENFTDSTLKEYAEFLKNRKIKGSIVKCLDEESLLKFMDECKKEVYEYSKKLGLNIELEEMFEKSCIELKREVILEYAKVADDKKIENMFKSLKSKFFIIGI
jgi:hypothetical protein